MGRGKTERTEAPWALQFADAPIRADRGVVLAAVEQLGTVLELAEELGIEARPESFTAQVLTDSDEIFITSTAGGVMPVTTLDGEQVGSGRPGPITLQLRQRYWEAHDEERWATPVASPEDIRHERGFGAP